MEPLPETVEALREMTRYGDDSVAVTLRRISREVHRIVPEIVGVSLSLVNDELTFTMTASSGSVAALDGMQYLDGGPCDEALRTGEPHLYRGDRPDDEARWQIFARATSASGIASTLSLPILREGAVVAGVNLYATTATAFEGHHEALAEACGAWAGGAVTNADLDFTTRFQAAETPARLRAERWIDQAVGVLMARWDYSVEEAERRLRQVAQRAGITDDEMARALIGLVADPADDQPDPEPDA